MIRAAPTSSAKRVTLVTAAVVFFVVAISSAGLAHRLYNGWSDTWSDGNGRCVNEKVTIDHGANRTGLFRIEVNAEKRVNTPYGTIDCYAPWGRPVGWIKTQMHFMKIDSNGRAQLCRRTPEFFSAHANTDYMSLKATAGSAPPCGPGLYKTLGFGYVQIEEDVWKGAAMMNSERHGLPVP